MSYLLSKRIGRLTFALSVLAATLFYGALSAMAATTIGTNISTDGTLTVAGDAAFDTDTLFVDVSEDRVGIGTTTPGNGLHVLNGTPNIMIESTGGTWAETSLFIKTPQNNWQIFAKSSGEENIPPHGAPSSCQ